jgi:lipopolysaccharide biosynthesis glycosyltransferase
MSNAIVMLVDDNSFIGACVTIYSLQKHAKRSYDLIVFYWDKLSELNKIKLKRINRNIIFKKILVDDYKLCKFSSLPRVWEYNCAYRFDIFTLSEYKKIIYIDCDFLVKNDITKLFSIKCDFGAVCTTPEALSQGNKKFNAGLMLIGKKYLSNKTKHDLIQLNLGPAPLFNNSYEWISDEPIFNSYFSELKQLNKKYNYLITSLKLENIDNVNLHFNGSVKPWQSNIFYKAFDNTFLRMFLSKTYIKGTLLLKKIFTEYTGFLSCCKQIADIE